MTRHALDELRVRDAAPTDSADLRALLESSNLPLDGIEGTRFIVAEHNGTIIACAGLEVHDSAAVLRSVAVAGEWQGRGVGEALVRRALGDADERALDPVVLLTTTAAQWFPRFGFVTATRDDVPAPLLASVEFTTACPASAAVMMRARPRAPASDPGAGATARATR